MFLNFFGFEPFITVIVRNAAFVQRRRFFEGSAYFQRKETK